jgi:hypothetical protein
MAIRVNDKITFIHIGKNAGTSISRILNDNFKTKESGPTHDGYHELPRAWQDNCFCVIRNPYDRLLSLYHFTCKKIKKLYNEQYQRKYFYEPQFKILDKGFKNFVLNEAETVFLTKPVNTNRKQSWSQKTQEHFLPIDRSKIQILRFENLEQDWMRLCERQGLTHHTLPRINTSRADSTYRDHYDKDMVNQVKKYWAKDIELGHYEF